MQYFWSSARRLKISQAFAASTVTFSKSASGESNFSDMSVAFLRTSDQPPTPAGGVHVGSRVKTDDGLVDWKTIWVGVDGAAGHGSGRVAPLWSTSSNTTASTSCLLVRQRCRTASRRWQTRSDTNRPSSSCPEMSHQQDDEDSSQMRPRRWRVTVMLPMPSWNSEALWEKKQCQEYKN